MADPVSYDPSYSFVDFQASDPASPLPAIPMDNQFEDISLSIGSLVDAVKDVRRADGKLKNAIVTKESLASDVYLGFGVPTVWATATDYAVNATVFYESKFYKASTAHNSGLAFVGANWTELADLSGAVIADSGVWFSSVDTIKTADYAIVAGDTGKMLVANKATAIAFTFATNAGLLSKPFLVKNIGAGTLTLAAAVAETIEGVASLPLPTGWMALVWGAAGTLRAVIWPGPTNVVSGPASTVNANFPSFSGTGGVGGAVLADSGKAVADFGKLVAMPEAIKTVDYAVLVVDAGKQLIANKATAIAFTLPALADAGTFPYFIRNIGVGDLTIDPSGSETIEGGVTFAMLTGEAVLIWPNGSTWRVFGVVGGTGMTVSTGGVVSLNISKLTEDTAPDTNATFLPGYNGVTTKKHRADNLAKAWSVAGGFRALKVLVTSNTEVAVTADALTVEDTNGVPRRLTAVNVSAAITASGVNGLDTGAEGASTWYYVWVIYNGATVAALLSTSATAPTMPSGYTFKYRVGAIRNDGSSNFWRTIQYGRRAQIIVGTNPTAMPTMDSGVKGSTTVPTWIAIAVAAFVPPTAAAILIVLTARNTGTPRQMAAPNNAYGVWDSASNPPPVVIGTHNVSAAIGEARPGDILIESASIYWASADAGGAIWARGWEDNL